MRYVHREQIAQRPRSGFNLCLLALGFAFPFLLGKVGFKIIHGVDPERAIRVTFYRLDGERQRLRTGYLRRMNPQKLEIRKMLVCSTAHLTRETAQLMECGENVGTAYDTLEGGFLVWVLRRELDRELIVCLARDSDCEHVMMLDCDGPQIEGLPCHEW
jgi:hypothetical protein